MKKGLLFSALLASLLLVGCASDKGGDEGGNGNNSEQTVEAKLVGDYDLTGITGKYDKNAPDKGIYLNGDIKDVFTNSVTKDAVSFASVTTGEKGSEKAQIKDKPQTGGVKLNSQHSSSGDFYGELTFALAEGKSVDKVVFVVRSWGAEEDFAVSLNGEASVQHDASAEDIELTIEKENMTTFSIKSDKDAVTNEYTKSRFVIKSIKLYA